MALSTTGRCNLETEQLNIIIMNEDSVNSNTVIFQFGFFLKVSFYILLFRCCDFKYMFQGPYI